MKYIFILFFALLFLKADAQNLQFSQVLTYAGRIENASIYQPSPLWTVPDGKVWKVEVYSLDFLHLNDVLLNNNSNQGVLWLKSGDAVQYKSPSNYLVDYKYILSIIEFTIVP
jgi:hypothetical protein